MYTEQNLYDGRLVSLLPLRFDDEAAHDRMYSHPYYEQWNTFSDHIKTDAIICSRRNFVYEATAGLFYRS
jgi:hypothetical protein